MMYRWISLPLNCHRTSLLFFLLSSVNVVLAANPANAQSPIVVTGYNQNIVYGNSSGSSVQGFDSANGAWFQSGLQGHQDGLPSTTTFTSAATNTVTGGHTQFNLQSGPGNDALQVGSSGSTMTFTNPSAYSNISIYAASANANANATGYFAINFSDGSILSNITYDAYDWSDNGQHANAVLSHDISRANDTPSSATGFVYDTRDVYNLYETDINLAAYGDAAKSVASVTFFKPGNAGETSVFGISGTPSVTPEPSSIAVCFIGAAFLILLRVRTQAKSRY